MTAPEGRIPAAGLWRVLEADTGRPIANGQTRVRTEADSTIRVDVGGLRPDTRYLYEFEVEGQPSPQGRTRTLPEGDVASIRFGQVSCAKFNAGHFNAYARLAERDDLHFLLHLGDWIYEASQTPPASQTASRDIGRPFNPLHECKTLDDYRQRYAQYRSDPDVQAISAAHPVISTVDDHEFADGAWRDGATEHKPERDGPWSERRASAFRAREEWLPVRRPDMASPERVFRSVPIGTLAELFMLDTRTMRDEPVPPPASSKKGRTALGPDQKAWLYEALRASTARWRLLGNPSVMSRTWNDSLPAFAREALVKVKLIDTDGTGPDYDQWDGYPHERRELLDVISKLPEANVVVLSGDVHVGLAGELAETPAEPPVAVEFVNTSLTSQNLDDKMGWGLRTESLKVEKTLLEGMPHLRYIDLDSHGYSVVDLDAERLRFEWWTVEASRPGPRGPRWRPRCRCGTGASPACRGRDGIRRDEAADARGEARPEAGTRRPPRRPPRRPCRSRHRRPRRRPQRRRRRKPHRNRPRNLPRARRRRPPPSRPRTHLQSRRRRSRRPRSNGGALLAGSRLGPPVLEAGGMRPRSP